MLAPRARVRRPNDRRSIGMDDRVVNERPSCHRAGGVGAGDWRYRWPPSARRRGRNSMSVRRRARPGAPAPSVSRWVPPRSRISARLPMRRSADAADRWEATFRRVRSPRRASRFSGSRGLRPRSSRMSSLCRCRSTANSSCPQTSSTTERTETWIWTRRSICSSTRTST